MSHNFLAMHRGLGRRAGFGDAAAFAQATADLSAQVGVPIQTGDTATNNGDFTGAVTAYQQAGNAGANTIGPEIDAAGAANATQPITQQAWSINGSLASISAAGASANDATSAQQLAKQMLTLYVTAIQAGQAAVASGAPTSTPSSGGTTIGIDPALQTAANAVVTYFQNNACTQSSIPEVLTFQHTYNANSTPFPQALATDGKYGAFTKAGLQVVLGVFGTTTAPPSCFKGGKEPPPGPVRPPPTPPTPTPNQAGVLSGSTPLWLLAALAAVAVVYEATKRKKAGGGRRRPARRRRR